MGKQIGSDGKDGAMAVAVDSKGNVYTGEQHHGKRDDVTGELFHSQPPATSAR